MKFNPTANNICHPDYNEYPYWTKKIAQDLTLRISSQGGTDHTTLQSYMIPLFKEILKQLGKEIGEIYEKAFKVKVPFTE